MNWFPWAQGRPCNSSWSGCCVAIALLKKENLVGLFAFSSLAHVPLPSIRYKLSFRQGEVEKALKHAAQGGGRVTIPEGVQETWRCNTEGHSLVGNIGARWMVGLDDLSGLFQL